MSVETDLLLEGDGVFIEGDGVLIEGDGVTPARLATKANGRKNLMFVLFEYLKIVI